MAALTLLEAEKLNPNSTVFRQGIIETIVYNAKLLQAFPFINITGNAYSYVQDGSLPSVGFRGVNEEYTASSGVVNPVTESLKIFGGTIEVDRALVAMNGQEIRSQQVSMKLRAAALQFTKKVIKGSETTSKQEFDGLQARIQSSQIIHAGSTAGGDALSVDKLDEAVDLCYRPTHILMNKTMRRRLSKAAKSTSIAGTITYTIDQFGAQIANYNGLPIIEIEKDETESEILDFTEACSGGGATGTSIYVVSLSDMGVTGLRNGEIIIEDSGLVTSATVYTTLVEQYVGMAILNGRSAVRIDSIKDAAVVA